MNIDNFINGPQRESDLQFCKKYIELSEYYWQLGDEEILKSIEAAMNSALVDYQSGKLEGPLKNKSIREIKKYFLIKKIKVLAEIPESMSTIIIKEIDKLLLKKRDDAKRLGFMIPENGRQLTLVNYYANYMVAQEVKKRLELHLGKHI